MANDPYVPEPPEITEGDLARARESGDFGKIFFEWYKYIAILCNYYASIQPNSPALKSISPVHFSVLIGLLNRCSRLMLANVALSHEGRFGETTAIIDRSIFESCVKVAWLSRKGSDESFRRFLADGFKGEFELKEKIEANIAARPGNGVMEIEKRMLASIGRYVSSTGLTESEIKQSKSLPDLATMLSEIGQDRLQYVVGQKLGSHSVHGTWISLRRHYLKEYENGMIGPRDHDCDTADEQFMATSLQVLTAMRSYVDYIFAEKEDATAMKALLNGVDDEIMKLSREISGNDSSIQE